MRSGVRSVWGWTGAGFSGLVITVSLQGLKLPGDRQGYEPVQPIEYSHRLHAGELRISCFYCHYGAEKSRNAGIPASSVCMNCHATIVTQSPELRKLYDAMGLDADLNEDASRAPEPIRWIRIHRLPDFVYFDHRSHVNMGVRCQTCHGPIETMNRVRQVSDLSMGSCVDCHRQANREGIQGKAVHATLDCTGCHF